MEHPRVAISYAHGPHDEEVFSLASRLIQEGVNCDVDLFDDAPAQGWPRFMIDVVNAPTVLVIASKEYYERFHRAEEGSKGKGAAFESGLLAQSVVDMKGWNERIIPIVLLSADVDFVPEFLRDVTRYDLSSEQGYENLYRRLTNQPRFVKPPLGQIRKLDSIEAPSIQAFSDERYAQQIDSALQESAGQGGLLIHSFVLRFNLMIYPQEYVDVRFDRGTLNRVVTDARSAARANIPIYDGTRQVTLSDGFQLAGYDAPTRGAPEYREYYRAFTNGLLVYTFVSPDDIQEDRQYRGNNRYIGYQRLLGTLTRMALFGSELISRYNLETTMRLRVGGLAGHRLADDTPSRDLSLGSNMEAHEYQANGTKAISPKNAKSDSLELATIVGTEALVLLGFPYTEELIKRRVNDFVSKLARTL